MLKILVLFAHPALDKSRVHARLIRNLPSIPGVRLHDLYEAYPDFDINVRKEQRLLLDHDIIIWQHPFYWYSAPAIIKQWQDLVLEHKWAYGSGGDKLKGKKIFNAISAGGSFDAYTSSGRNRCTVRTLLGPFEQTAFLCQMEYLPPFVVHGTHRLTDFEIEEYGQQYETLLQDLSQGRLEDHDWHHAAYLNESITPSPST